MKSPAGPRAGDSLSALLSRVSPNNGTYRPRRLSLGRGEDRQRLERLFDQGAVHQIHDSLALQLDELAEIRRPAADLDRQALDAAISELLAGCDPIAYGCWIHYPWSGRLVHVLPQDQFEEVRTSRNRYKITRPEQRRLRTCAIGIVGLSAGYAVAETLALEGIGGHFRLADHDAVALSNTNRLSGGVSSLSQNKAVLAARRMSEIDPYIDVEALTDGITEESLEGFLTGGRKLDLLIEECDDLATKIRLREQARVHRVPVLMETNDRGLLDVERFDLEPERPIFHGLISLSAAEVERLPTREKLPFMLELLGSEQISDRGAASLLEIDASLKGWPQLASGTALGGALVADTARRLLLGELTSSGRFHVDFGTLIADQDSGQEELATRSSVKDEPAVRQPPPLLPLAEEGGLGLSKSQVRELVGRAITAPSGGNTQPWSFVWRDRWLECWIDPERPRSLLDFEAVASELALGAAVENLSIAAGAAGLSPDIQRRPSDSQDLLCRIRFSTRRRDSQLEKLLPWIGRRCTNRTLAPRRRLGDEERAELQRTARRHGATLTLLEDEAELEPMGELLGEIDRLRFFSLRLHREMMAEVRWSPEEAARTRDGLDIATLELASEEIAAMKLLRQRRVVEALRRVGGGGRLADPARDAIQASAAVGLLRRPDREGTTYFEGGRAVQRLWLRATEMGISLQPWSAAVFLFARLEEGGEGLLSEEREILAAARARWHELLPNARMETELLLFRLTYAPGPSQRSLRRPISNVLTFA